MGSLTDSILVILKYFGDFVGMLVLKVIFIKECAIDFHKTT